MRGRAAVTATLAFAVLLALALAAVAPAETIQRGALRVAFDGQIVPKELPREGSAPVRVAVSTAITTTDGRPPPPLRQISIAINRYGRLDLTGLPVCEVEDIQPATTAKALGACRGSLVGKGSFSAQVTLGGQATFPSRGEMIAFNGTYNGHPAILAHVYGTEPVPTSVTLPFLIGHSKGTFGTVLTARFPAAEHSYVTGLKLSLFRRFSYRGGAHSYASAACPAPKGFPGAVFPFAKASYSFAGGQRLSSTLARSCKARG